MPPFITLLNILFTVQFPFSYAHTFGVPFSPIVSTNIHTSHPSKFDYLAMARALKGRMADCLGGGDGKGAEVSGRWRGDGKGT